MESLAQIGKCGFKFNPNSASIKLDGLIGLKLDPLFSGDITSIYACQICPAFSSAKRVYLNNVVLDVASGTSVDGLYGYFSGGTISGSAASVYGIYIDSVTGAGQVTNAFGGYFKTPAIGGNRCALYSDDLRVGAHCSVDNSGNLTLASMTTNGNVKISGSLIVLGSLTGVSATYSGDITCSNIIASAGSFSVVNIAGLSIDGANLNSSASSLVIQKILSLSSLGASLVGQLVVDSFKCATMGIFTGVQTGALSFQSSVGSSLEIVELEAGSIAANSLMISGETKLNSVDVAGNLNCCDVIASKHMSANSLTTASVTVNGPSTFAGAIRLQLMGGLVCVDQAGLVGLDSSGFNVSFHSLNLATPLSVASGGTGYNSWASGDLFAGGAKLPIGQENYVLTSIGGGVVWKSCPGNVLSVSGVAGHITADSSVGNVVLRLPQAIGTTDAVVFHSINLSDSLIVGGHIDAGDVKCGNINARDITLNDLNASGSTVLNNVTLNNLKSGIIDCAGVNSAGPVYIGSFNPSALFSVWASSDINCVAQFSSSINAANGNSYGLMVNNRINVTSDSLVAGLFLNNQVSSRSPLSNIYGLYIDAGVFDCINVSSNYGAYIKRPSSGTSRIALFAENIVVADGAELGGTIRIKAGFTGLCCVGSDGLLSNNTSQTTGNFASVGSAVPINTASGGTGFARWAAGEMPVGNSVGVIDKLIPGAAGQILMSNGPNCSPSWRYDTLASTPLTGTPDSINITLLADKILFSTPQAIGCASTPQFARLGLGVVAHDRYALDVAGVARFSLGYADRISLGAYCGTDPTNSGSFVTSGAVGIGTNSPQYSLDVSGAARVGVLGIGCAPNSTYALSVTGAVGLYGAVDITGKLSAGSIETTGRILSEGGLIANTKALATNATDGYLYSTATMGIPVGAPTVQPGVIPMVYDLNNDTQYVFNDGWKNVGGAIVAYANHTRAAIDNTLSRLCVKQTCIVRGAAWFNGTKTMAGYFDTMVVQQPGDYSLSIGGQIKSAGNGTTHVKITRASAVIYDQTYTSSISSDGAFKNEHILLDMRVGDVIIMDVCEKNNASPLASITDATNYGGGQLIMRLV